MPKTQKIDPAAALAATMLGILQSRRTLGGEAYPPTVRQLAELIGVPPEAPVVLKAVGKKSFTGKAKAVGKGKTTLDSRVYFNEDAPQKRELLEREVSALAERLLDVLESRRRLGGNSYPPTVRELAELSGVQPVGATVLKAVGKKSFTDMATAKVGGKVTLDSRVYFNEDAPTKAELLEREVAALAGKMLRVLESQRQLGGDAYPPTLGRLAELCGLNGSAQNVPKAAAHETMARETLLAGGGKPERDAPVILNRDRGPTDADLVPALLEFAFRKSRTEKVQVFSPEQLSKKLHKTLQARFVDELNRRITRRQMPADYAWVINKVPILFLASDIQTTPPAAVPPAAHSAAPTAPARDFVEAFRESFERFDRRNGKTNHVKLLDLRRELADFDRQRFDAELDRIRGAGREFSLDGHEGLHKPLSPEEREAGILDAGSLLVYVSRR